MRQHALFAVSERLPEGLVYRPAFLSTDEEAALLSSIAELTFHSARYHAYAAKRRIVSFGFEYDFDRNDLAPAAPLPPAFTSLRARAAEWAAMPEADLTHALVAEYQPGTPLGWHRDAPAFGSVIGISLASACRMRFRPYIAGKTAGRAAFALDLAPRSIYLLRGEARWRWQHSISPTKSLRYSITFRSLRAGGEDQAGALSPGAP